MKKLDKYIKQLYTAILPVLAILLPFFIIRPILDNDIWFMLNHGRYILQNGFTCVEPFTVHEGFVFSFEKWLTCIIFYLSYSIGGKYGIFVILYSVGILASILIVKISKYLAEGNSEIASIVAIVIELPLFYFYFATRPQIFSYVCILLEFYLCEKYAKTNERKYLNWLPLISFVYMQLHSTMWPMFFIVLLPYIAEFKFIKKLSSVSDDYDIKYLLLIALISFLVGFINPYGAWSVTYLFKSISMTDIGISELKHLTIEDLFSMTLFVIPALHIVYWLLYSINCIKNKSILKLDTQIRYLYFTAGTLIMAFYAARNTCYFIILAGLSLAAMFKNLILKDRIINVSIFYLLIALILLVSLTYNSSINVLKEKRQAYELLDKLSERCNPSDTRMYTDFNSGSYAEWLGFRTYIDPRAEVFYIGINGKKDILQEFVDFEDGKIPVEDMQKEYKFDYYIITCDSKIKSQLDNSFEYEQILKNDKYCIYKTLGEEK